MSEKKLAGIGSKALLFFLLVEPIERQLVIYLTADFAAQVFFSSLEEEKY
jgi:hypothetical protein